jgi:hypothetical protein
MENEDYEVLLRFTDSLIDLVATLRVEQINRPFNLNTIEDKFDRLLGQARIKIDILKGDYEI